MKNPVPSLLVLLGLFTTLGSIYSQCEPDTINCKDIDEPGQMCPTQLPAATVGEPYEVVLTVIPPNLATIPGFPPIEIAYITVDTVENIPEGLSYEANADIFYADTAYCILISGTPTKAGIDTLSITVTPYVLTSGIIVPTPPIKDDTSIVVSVQEPAGFDPNAAFSFQVLPNIPNPFGRTTTLRFFTPSDERVNLRVYSILGELMYEEEGLYPPGENSFGFTGEDLDPGTFIYRIHNQKEVYTGKLVKARR
jgi:hypothetical protein